MLYDIIIIGGAPGGLSAAIYGARQGSKVLVLEKGEFGGQAVKTSMVENYPGFDSARPSQELIYIMVDQAEKFGAELKKEEVVELDLERSVKKIKTLDNEYQAKSVIIATGAQPRKLGVPGEEEFTAKGIGYCATCDASFFQDMDVYVIGGGNSALDEGLYLTKFARSVTLIVRGDKLDGDEISQKRAQENEKISFLYKHSVKDFKGNGLLKEMTIVNNDTGEEKLIGPKEDQMAFGVFIFIGSIPTTDIFKGKVEMDDWGYIKTNENMETNVPGVYACGDCRTTNFRQVITAAADGAIAAHFAGREIDQNS